MLEQEIISLLPADIILPDKGDWKEPVGRYLLTAYLADPTDTRILTYCFPTINAVLVANLDRLSQLGWDQSEIFNSLVLALVPSLHKYQPAKGELFPYLLYLLRFRVIDIVSKRRLNYVPLDENHDEPYEDQSYLTLQDLIRFIRAEQKRVGPTASRIFGAISAIISDSRLNLHSQEVIISHVCSMTKMPDVIIKPIYDRLLERFTE